MYKSYGERSAFAQNVVAQQLLQLMETKKTNLAVAADVTTKAELFALIHAVGPYICMLKTHIDILNDFDETVPAQLSALAQYYNFLIFEDRKFADIGNTVMQQYTQGIYRIADWAHMVNAHVISGPDIVVGLKKAGLPKQRGLLLLAQMSSAGNLLTSQYTHATVSLAHAHPDFVMGFICRERLCDDPGMVHCTPGVQLQEGSDALGQRYLTPQYVIGELGSDVIIVGRGIYHAADPAHAAREYQDSAWRAYIKRISGHNTNYWTQKDGVVEAMP